MGKPNLLWNIMEKMYESIWNDGMTKQTKSQTPKFELTQDFKWAWWRSKFMLEMLLEKDCAMFLNFFPKTQSIAFFENCSKGGT
jgi:hypothetical protein